MAANIAEWESPNGFNVRVCTRAETSLEEAVQEAKKLTSSAQGQNFNVKFKDILEKFGTSDLLFFYTADDGNLAAFGSLLKPTGIPIAGDSEIKLVYAHGLIVDQAYAKRRICTQFLRAAGKVAKVVVGHTQNRNILRAFRKAFRYVWPSQSSEALTRLTPEFAAAIRNYLKSIERPQPFDTVTGLVPDFYPEPLYAEEGEGRATGGTAINEDGDATLVIGFEDAQLYARLVEPVVESDARQDSSTVRHTEAMAPDYVHSMLVGWGHAARDLHEPCIRKAAELDSEHLISGRVVVVERNPLIGVPPRLSWSRTIAEANANPQNTVVHVTTGPADRVAAVREAAKCGFKSFILEKPLAASRSEHEELVQIVEDNQLKVVVNFPWLGTPLTRELKEIIESNKHGKLLGLTMIQAKSRHRAIEASGHVTAFDIETPHQVSLALYLAGMNAHLLDASCKPLVGENDIIPAMGGTSMLMSHGYTVSNLRSELESHRRERRIELLFEDGWRCIGCYPASGDDDCHYLWQYDRMGNLRSANKFFADPMTSFFLESYRYFLRIAPTPVSTFDLAITTANLISEAKRACGVEVESIWAAPLRGIK